MLPIVVPLLRDILESEGDHLARAARLPEPLRNRVLGNRSRHISQILDIVRVMVDPPRTIPLQRPNFTIDITGDLLRTFHEPVPVVPTAAQIQDAVEQNATPPTDTMCAICQETVATSTRLLSCNHHFHHACITQWFSTSVRCPVCRNDIRGEDEEEE